MCIAGSDVVLLAPAGECVGDAILRACRRHWQGRECLFQDAHEQELHSFSDPWVWIEGASRKEFSVYRDASAAAAWKKHGAVKENANTMLHFLLGDAADSGTNCVEVALVFDKYTAEIRLFIKRLQATFLAMTAQTPLPEVA